MESELAKAKKSLFIFSRLLKSRDGNGRKLTSIRRPHILAI